MKLTFQGELRVVVERVTQYLLIAIGMIMLVAFCLFGYIGGDISDTLWRFVLAKVHFAHEWSMPYYTPARCGGFLLAADANDLLFTLYMPISLLVPNVLWAVKITNFILTLFLALGVFIWLRYFGVTHYITRIFVGFLFALCGYWMCHVVTMGQLWAHGIAFIPWIMIFVEELLTLSPSLHYRYLRFLALLIFLFFLIINSGYYWLQVLVPVLFARVICELVVEPKKFSTRIKRIAMIGACGLFAILLGWIRLGGVYEFQITKFPRLGGNLSHYQVMGETLDLIKMLWRSFFDPSIIVKEMPHGMLGGFHEYTNFIGIFMVIPIAVGLSRFKFLSSKRAFWGMLLASCYQLILVRTTHLGDLVREVFPIYKQISWHWRGSAILIFLACILIASGFEWMWQKRNCSFKFLCLFLMLLNLGQLFFTYKAHNTFTPFSSVTELCSDAMPGPTNPLTIHYRRCMLSNLFGYGNDMPPQVITHIFDYSYDAVIFRSIYDEGVPGFYNINDVRRLAGPEAANGYYFTHPWPLWPKTDREAFERFIRYKQVIDIPLRLKVGNAVSIFFWVLYFLGIVLIVLLRRREQRNVVTGK